MTERRKRYCNRKLHILSFFFRRRETRSQSASERSVQFDDLQNGYENLGASTSSLVYQNVGDSGLSIKGMLKHG